MNSYNASYDEAVFRNRFAVCATAFATACMVSGPLRAAQVTPPPVPPALQPPVGNEAFVKGHAIGTQIYICLSFGIDVAWALIGPQATLFTDHDKQIMTHFRSPNPLEDFTPRLTWQDSGDTSAVWTVPMAIGPSPPGAISWQLLSVVGAQNGPTGGDDKLAETTFIQRVNTLGGVAPSTGCAGPSDVGRGEFVPYEADYFFYKAAR
jgi:hypothetical protein